MGDRDRYADLLDAVAEFDREFPVVEHMDMVRAWELIAELAEALADAAGLPAPTWADDPNPEETAQ
jgi:hypothetical protein